MAETCETCATRDPNPFRSSPILRPLWWLDDYLHRVECRTGVLLRVPPRRALCDYLERKLGWDGDLDVDEFDVAESQALWEMQLRAMWHDD